MAYAAKFWVAAAMGVAAFARVAYGVNMGFDETTATGIVSGITALLVYLVPNKVTK